MTSYMYSNTDHRETNVVQFDVITVAHGCVLELCVCVCVQCAVRMHSNFYLERKMNKKNTQHPSPILPLVTTGSYIDT